MQKDTYQYGKGNTVHQNSYLDVEVDENGLVVALWYRCMPLPFKQHQVTKERAREMTDFYKSSTPPKVFSIEIENWREE